MENIVVVIDPGHGGENLGAEYNNIVEKDINLILAKALVAELSKYEGIDVYLTRDTDIDLDLDERAEIANDLNADFLFCYHFNMSVEHDLFGTETWVCSRADLYEPAASFSEIQIASMVDLGLYSRGCKTKLNDSGTDYYGILRHCASFDIPAVLIEHGHLDHTNDSIYLDGTDNLINLGQIDATNIAKYFKLKSDVLGVDYSNYEVPNITTDLQVVKPDATDPDVCSIEKISENYENGEITISITGSDKDCSILYFSYSLDGGENFSELYAWPENTDTFTHSIVVPSNTTPNLCIKIDNLFDLEAVSNILSYDLFSYEIIEYNNDDLADEQLEAEDVFAQTETAINDSTISECLTHYFPIIVITLFCLVLLFLLITMKIRKYKIQHNIKSPK